LRRLRPTGARMSDLVQPLAIVCAAAGLAIAIWAEGSYRFRRLTIARRVNRLVRDNPVSAPVPQPRRSGSLAAAAERLIGLFGEPVWPRRAPAIRVLASGVGAGAFAAGGLALLGLPWWFGAIVAFAVAVMVPYLLLEAEQSKEAKAFEAMLSDTIDMMVRMLRAGMPVTIAVDRIGVEAQEPAGTVYREVGQWLRLGLPLPQAMRTVAERIQVKDFDFFAAALSIQNTVGGNLTATLESLAAVIRERTLAMLKARAVTAQARLTANIILCILPAIVVMMQLTQPGYLAPLVDGSNGYQLISFVVASYLFALLTIRRMVSRVKIG